MSGPGFIHLHVHSAYSLLEGALQLETILKLAAGDEQPALGIADTGNLFGALEFSEKASKKGIQPLIGVELAIDFAADEERISERNKAMASMPVRAAAPDAKARRIRKTVSGSVPGGTTCAGTAACRS